MVVNLNEVAREVTLNEGGEISLPIGQVKEVIRLFIKEMTIKYELYDIILCLRKHGEIIGLDTRKEKNALKKFLEDMEIC